jgi:hypothetical protein
MEMPWIDMKVGHPWIIPVSGLQKDTIITTLQSQIEQ